MRPDVATHVDWYRRMLEIRLFEEKVQELFMEGLIEGTTHLCQGQEAVSVGAISALRDDDYLTITYRGHGHALMRGVPMESCFAELMGRSTGCCKGVGGSMHFTDVAKGLLGAFAIVGAGLPVALGAAYSAKLQGLDRVALTFFGDGATQHRDVPRGDQHGRRVEGRRRLHRREQPVRRVHAAARHDAARRPRRAREGLRHPGRDRRRTGRRRGPRGGRPRRSPGHAPATGRRCSR